VFDIHGSCSRQQKTSRDIFRIAAGSLKVLCFFLGRQHIVFARRQSALLKKEEAVGKGEVEKCTSATHNLGYYRRVVKILSRILSARWRGRISAQAAGHWLLVETINRLLQKRE